MGFINKLFGKKKATNKKKKTANKKKKAADNKKKKVVDNTTALEGPIRIKVSDVLAVAFIADSPDIDIDANDKNFFWSNYNQMNPGLLDKKKNIRWHLARLGKEITRKDGVLLSDFLSCDLTKGLGNYTVWVQVGRVNYTTFDSSVQNVSVHILTFVKPMPNFKKIMILDIAPNQFVFV